MADIEVFVWYGDPEDIVEGDVLVELDVRKPLGIWDTVDSVRLRPHEDTGDSATLTHDPFTISDCADYRVRYRGETWYGADIEAFEPPESEFPEGQEVCGGESRNWGRDIVRAHTDMVEVGVTVEDPGNVVIGDVTVELEKRFRGVVDSHSDRTPFTTFLRHDPVGECAQFRLRVEGSTADGAPVVKETAWRKWCDFTSISRSVVLTGDDVQREVVETTLQIGTDKITVPMGDTVRFIGDLEEAGVLGGDISDAPVRVEDADVGETLATGRTNGAGDFPGNLAIPWVPDRAGEVTIQAIFDGLTRGAKVFQPSRSGLVTFTVEREDITINFTLEDPEDVVEGEATVRLVKSLWGTVDTESVDPPGTVVLNDSPVGDCADYTIEVEATSPRGNPVRRTLSERKICRGVLSMTVRLSSEDEERPGQARLRVTDAEFEAPQCESDEDLSAELVATVRNEGDRAGSATVQLSAVDPSGRVAASVQRTVTLGVGDDGEVSSGAVVLSTGTWSPVAEVV